jgi:4-aminobutyrate aminotransferase
MDRETVEPSVDSFPGSRAREWVDRHHEVAAPAVQFYEFVWDRSAPAIGPFCTDVDGNVFLDFAGHIAVSPLGYNNPELLARLDEFDLVDPVKMAGTGLYLADEAGDTPTPVELMERIVDVTAPPEFAMKVCYDATGGTRALTFDGAYHGQTLGALSLDRSSAIYHRGVPELPGIEAVPFCPDRSCTPATCGCGFFVDAPGPGGTGTGGGSSRLREVLHPDRGHVNPEEVAFLAVEPIQGVGGYRVPSDAFFEEVAAVADEHDLVVVADEVQSGLGRTGEWWALDHYPLDPDVVCAAKALRVGATVGRSDLFPEAGKLTSTWGAGDHVAAAAGAFTIDIIEEEGLLANATARGRQFRETFSGWDPSGEGDRLPGVVDVRGKGLMLAVEFDSPARRDAVLEDALERGLLLLPAGYSSVRVLPPLDVRDREIELGADLLRAAVREADGRV